MLAYSKSRIISAMLLSGMMLFGAGASDNKDPFAAYRNFEKKPLDLKGEKLEHFDEEALLLREKLTLDLSRKERAILAGLHFVLNFVDADKHFKFLFPDFLLLMHAMSHSHGRVHQKEVAKAIIKKALKRGYAHLKEFFPQDEMAGWRFSGIFPVLAHYPEEEKRYFEFYKQQWPRIKDSKAPDARVLREAMARSEYKELFNFLVFSSFPHWYLHKVKTPPVPMPEDKYPSYLKAFEEFTYKDHAYNSTQFRNLGYLATHIPLILTNYGEYPLKDSLNAKKAEDYINASFEKARLAGDFDLYAEYIQCLKMYGKDARTSELEDFLYDLQRPDGSWGSDRDFKKNAYTAIHPSGAAMMALNQP